jgi:hypothetical protein
MLTYVTYAIFPIMLFFLAAVLVTGAPVALSLTEYYKNRGRQSVKCPETGQTVGVEVDNKFAFRMALRGQEHSRLSSCSRWPEKGDCGQECLMQLDASPENLQRLLSTWMDGKSCAICTRAITPSDWEQSRLAVLNQDHELFELRDLPAEDLQTALEYTRPLCLKCHQQERERQSIPFRAFKGSRFGLSSLHDSV